MPAFSNADQVVIRGYWKDEVSGGGIANATVTFDPVPLTSSTRTPNLRDLTAFGHLKLRQVVATVNPSTGYYAAIVTANNDPDLDAYLGRRVTFTDEDPFTIQVPYTASSVTVDAPMAAALPSLTVGQSVKAIWLVEAALVDGTPPAPLAAYMTAVQTTSAIATAIGTVRQVPSGGTSGQVVTKNSDSTYGWATPASGGGGGGSTPDATTSTKGQSVILGGTADAPTVPYNKVTGTPSSLPPSGGAGGVLGGTYPNPSFAVDMATQAELDAVNASIPEQARDAIGAALVAGSGITVTVNDAADTITLTATGAGGGSYTDEQAQDAMAALLSAGTQSGITFTYDDAGNALSATVPANSAAGTPSLRALGTGATQAAAGNDARLSDARAWTLYGGGAPSSGQVPAWNGTSFVPTTVSSGGAVSDATTTSKGVVQLAGDLAGTAAAPTVPALTSKAPTARNLTAGTGLTGGGDLSADRSFAVAYGTASGTAAQGNDTRLTDSRPWSLYNAGTAPTSGQVPAWNGSAYVPTTPAAGGGTTFTQAPTKTAAYTANPNEIVPVDTISAAFTVTGPTSGAPFGVRWIAGTAAPTVAAPSGYTINGAASLTMALPPTTAGELITWQAFGTDYQPIDSFKPQSALNAQHGAILNTHLTAWVNTAAFRIAAARTDTVGTTSGSATVTDTTVTAADQGRPVTGTGIPSPAYVGTVTAGTSFLLSSSPTTQTNTNATVTNASASITLLGANRDTNGALVRAAVVWPDGATGTYNTTTASTSAPGAVDAFTITYVNGAITRTATQAAPTRDATGGVVAQPALTIA